MLEKEIANLLSEPRRRVRLNSNCVYVLLSLKAMDE